MQPTITTIPASAPWKPTRDQVRAAALAFARVSGAEWMKLPASSREDFLIDGHAALMAAHAVAPIPGAAGKEVVCMSREHADLYAKLLRNNEETILRLNDGDASGAMNLVLDRIAIVDRLRALASPERTTPPERIVP